MGAGVVVAQYLWAKDREDAQIAVHTSLAIAAILGVVLTVCISTPRLVAARPPRPVSRRETSMRSPTSFMASMT